MKKPVIFTFILAGILLMGSCSSKEEAHLNCCNSELNETQSGSTRASNICTCRVPFFVLGVCVDCGGSERSGSGGGGRDLDNDGDDSGNGLDPSPVISLSVCLDNNWIEASYFSNTTNKVGISSDLAGKTLFLPVRSTVACYIQKTAVGKGNTDTSWVRVGIKNGSDEPQSIDDFDFNAFSFNSEIGWIAIVIDPVIDTGIPYARSANVALMFQSIGHGVSYYARLDFDIRQNNKQTGDSTIL